MFKIHLKVGCSLILIYICLRSGKNRFLYSKLCYFGITKGEMIKFATVMANCVRNKLRKFCKKILNYNENNDICLLGSFLLPHTVVYRT